MSFPPFSRHKSLPLAPNSAAPGSPQRWFESDLGADGYHRGGMWGWDVNCSFAICAGCASAKTRERLSGHTWESCYRHTWKPSRGTSSSICSLATYLFLTKITSGFHFLVTTRLDKTLSRLKKKKLDSPPFPLPWGTKLCLRSFVSQGCVNKELVWGLRAGVSTRSYLFLLIKG